MYTDAQIRVLKKRSKRVGFEFLLALLNTSLILFIVAAVLVMVATSEVKNLAKDVAADATAEVIKLAGAEIEEVVSKIESIDSQLRQVSTGLAKIVDHPQVKLSIDKRDVEYLNASIDSLADIVSDVKTEAANFVFEAEEYLQVATAEIDSIRRELLHLHRELSEVLEKQDLKVPANVRDVNNQLLASVKNLSTKIELLASSNQEITDQTIETIGAVVTESIIDIKHCRPISVVGAGK